MIKLCPICKEWFSKPKGNSNKVWEAQECCGKDCSAIYRRVENPVRTDRRKELVPGARRFARV